MALKDLTEEDYKNIINNFNTEPIPAWQSLRTYITMALDEGRLDAQVKPATCDTRLIIKLLLDSFDKAQRQLDKGTIDDLKLACAELVISNAEARQALSK